MAIVKSLSVIVTAVFSGRAIEDICMLSPISSPSKSISITVGIDSTEHFSSIDLRTTFNTPPFLIPGDFSRLIKLTGISRTIFFHLVSL